MQWADDPRELDGAAWLGDLHACLGVLVGASRCSAVRIGDERLRYVAAVGEACRDEGALPTPLRIATVIIRLTGHGDGASVLRWVYRLVAGAAPLPCDVDCEVELGRAVLSNRRPRSEVAAIADEAAEAWLAGRAATFAEGIDRAEGAREKRAGRDAARTIRGVR